MGHRGHSAKPLHFFCVLGSFRKMLKGKNTAMGKYLTVREKFTVKWGQKQHYHTSPLTVIQNIYLHATDKSRQGL